MTKINLKFSKDQLLVTIRKKKTCNAEAQAIVESLLEWCIDCDEFLSKIKAINQCHYNDVVEERCIIRRCGYPICRNYLKDVPKKTYEISTATNKVYDISNRKKFCSTQCFKASEYIKSQMLTSPLWMRDEGKIPLFKLLEFKTN